MKYWYRFWHGLRGYHNVIGPVLNRTGRKDVVFCGECKKEVWVYNV